MNRSLAINPSWSSDGRAIAYTSYRRGYPPDIYVSYIYQGVETPAAGTESVHNFLPAFSPDGTRIAFMTNRDGNMEIYSVNRDGSNLRRVTRHPATTRRRRGRRPATRSPSRPTDPARPRSTSSMRTAWGRRDASRVESWADRATWSPAPYNEIAYAGRTGPGFDIKIFSLEQGQIRPSPTAPAVTRALRGHRTAGIWRLPRRAPVDPDFHNRPRRQ